MKIEGFSKVTQLVDFLNNNLLLAYYCGFNIMKKLPFYTVFNDFINEFDNEIFKTIMSEQVHILAEKGIIDTSFIGLDSTPVVANTSQNNPKAFKTDKFNPSNQPNADKDCRLGIHTASNNANEKKFQFYWGYKNHVVVDCITGLPIYEMTTPANIADSTVTLDILSKTNEVLSIDECYFIADKAYDVKNIYHTIHNLYNGECFIPINKRNSKNSKCLPVGNPICDAGLAMHRDGKFIENGRTRQKFCCPFKRSKNGSCPCNHKNWNNGKKNRGCTKYQIIPDDLRLSKDRKSKAFKKIYSLRTECERYNSRFKNTGQERMWVRNIKAVSNLNTIAHIALLAVAIAAVTTTKQSYRKLVSVKRLA